MKNTVLKSLAAALALIFFSASVYCSIESLAETLAHAKSSAQHHDHDGKAHQDTASEPAHGHHHSNIPKSNDESEDFCCSQLNAIPNQWNNPNFAAKNLISSFAVHAVNPESCSTPIMTHGRLLHDKSPPPRLRSTLFWFLNFPTHAPPSFSAC
jgi:hypothetical protein